MTKQNSGKFLNKPMLVMVVTVAVLYGAIFGYKMFKGFMMAKFMKAAGAPLVTVSTTKIGYQKWQPIIKASGTLRAMFGVDVTSEISGLVSSTHFVSGMHVHTGAILVKLNDEQEIAELRALQAAAELSKITYERDKEQFKVKAISQAMLDADYADLKSKEAQVAAKAATVAKKTIKAPFSGRIGISNINPGSYINPGDKIVTLQSLDQIYLDFTIPQQQIVQLALGQSVYIKTDTYPEETFSGRITTIEPKIDPLTRNVQVEATMFNPKHLLLPGMFAKVTIHAGEEKHFLTLPQTAISFNPYGEIVYIVKESNNANNSKPILTATQTFVTVGERRGDQIVILSGLKEGDEVVASGQLKLQNGSQVHINNDVQPSNNPMPDLVDE